MRVRVDRIRRNAGALLVRRVLLTERGVSVNQIEKLHHHKVKEPKVGKHKARKAWAIARAAKRYAAVAGLPMEVRR